jgi:hypothetical protein
MVLSEFSPKTKGVVLGEESGNKSQRENRNKHNETTSVEEEPPVVTVAPPPEVDQPSAGTEVPVEVVTVAPTEAVTPTPTIIITPQPTQATTTSDDRTQTATTEVQSSSGVVVTTTSRVDRSTSETVRQIARKLGIRTAVPTTEVAAPVIKQAVKVVEEKTAAEILAELSSVRGETSVKEVRLRYRFVNGRMTLVGETDTGQESPLTPSESASILARLQRAAALAVAADAPGEMVFTKGQIRAVTNLPLLVDLKTNLLTTETSTGIRAVPLLPDEAIKIAFASRVVDGIYPKKTTAEIEFKEAENGRLIYQINGLSKRKLFGILPITLKETAVIDTSNGQVSQPEKSFGKLLLELIAIPAN